MSHVLTYVIGERGTGERRVREDVGTTPTVPSELLTTLS